MSNRNTRTVALVRVSTDRQDVDVQRQQIERWAASQDTPLAEWYEEHATSGAAKRRPVLDRLLADARRGKVGTLVVVALDRLGRSAIDVLNNLHELDATGVRVMSLRESLDFGTAAGRLVASVLAHVAEIERENLRARTRAGLAAARKRGKTLGRPRLRWTDYEIEQIPCVRLARTGGQAERTSDAKGAGRVGGDRPSIHRHVARTLDPSNRPGVCVMYEDAWWRDRTDEPFWLEITRRSDLGADLNAPDLNEDGDPYWGYDLLREARDGDVVFQYYTACAASAASSPNT